MGPPLFAKGPSPGLIGIASVPTKSPLALPIPGVNPVLPLFRPIKLCPNVMNAPLTSAGVPEFPATMLFQTSA